MNKFIQRHASSVIGKLSGFDRLLFRGTLRRIANAAGLASFLSYTGVLLKNFGDHAEKLTEQVRKASMAVAEKAKRPAISGKSVSAQGGYGPRDRPARWD